jgi:hypothetical protein
VTRQGQRLVDGLDQLLGLLDRAFDVALDEIDFGVRQGMGAAITSRR